VLLNDLIALRGEWVDFTRRFSESYGIDMGQLPDPMQGVLTRVKNSLQLFGLQLADEVKGIALETVYNAKRARGKTTFEVKARAIYEANTIPELVTDVLGQYVDVVKECLTVSHRMRVTMGF
jgi:hypothetical protein